MRYIGNGIYRERVYLDRQPKVGDRVEYIDQGIFADFPYGSEGTITSVRSSVPVVLLVEMDRSAARITHVHEDYVRIYEDRYYKVSKEEVVKRRFLGIPFGSKTIQTYEEVTEC